MRWRHLHYPATYLNLQEINGMNMLKFKPRGTRLELRLFYAHVDGRHSHPILAFVEGDDATSGRGKGGGG